MPAPLWLEISFFQPFDGNVEKRIGGIAMTKLKMTTTPNLKTGTNAADSPHKAAAEGSQVQRKSRRLGQSQVQSRSEAHDRVGDPVQGPMSQQSAFGSNAYDIHPQKFVRLVGSCV